MSVRATIGVGGSYPYRMVIVEKNRAHKSNDLGGSSGNEANNAPPFTILVVDGIGDDPGLFTDFLKTQGHFVLRAESEEDALEKAAEYQPNMILLGCDMASISCLELLPKLFNVVPSAAVLMVASHPSIPETVIAMDLGAVDFLVLPIDLTLLKAAIDMQKALFG